MKTLSVSEAAANLANWLKKAIAGEKICIQSDGSMVELHPLPSNGAAKKLSPREALRQLQQAAHLSSDQAENYLREVHAERLAAEKRST